MEWPRKMKFPKQLMQNESYYPASVFFFTVSLDLGCLTVWCLMSVSQGSRVWLRYQEQLLPSTVSSGDDTSLVLTTDYGKVRGDSSLVIGSVHALISLHVDK